MAEEALKAAKTDRRTAKGALTRCGKSLAKLLEAKRPEQEVRDGLSKLQLAFDTLVEKHEYYSRLLEDDSEFEVQEGWMAECQKDFMSMEMGAKMYLDSFLSKGKTPLKTYDASAVKNNGVTGPGSSGIPSMELDDDAPSVSSGGNNHPINTEQSTSSGNDNKAQVPVMIMTCQAMKVDPLLLTTRKMTTSKLTPVLQAALVVLRWKSLRCPNLQET